MLISTFICFSEAYAAKGLPGLKISIFSFWRSRGHYVDGEELTLNSSATGN